VGTGNRAVGARLGHVFIRKGKSLWRSHSSMIWVFVLLLSSCRTHLCSEINGFGYGEL
jgi:hypothetical protein